MTLDTLDVLRRTLLPAALITCIAFGVTPAAAQPDPGASTGPVSSPVVPVVPVVPAVPAVPLPPVVPATPAVPVVPAPASQAPVEAPLPPGDPRVVIRVSLPDGRTVVVAEGDHESRSIGSYAVRLYEIGGPTNAPDRFLAGLVRPRDGSVERVVVEDLDRDGRADVVVVMRASGSGGYLSADAYSYASNRLVRRASVTSVPPTEDIVRLIAPRVRRATAP